MLPRTTAVARIAEIAAACNPSAGSSWPLQYLAVNIGLLYGLQQSSLAVCIPATLMKSSQRPYYSLLQLFPLGNGRTDCSDGQGLRPVNLYSGMPREHLLCTPAGGPENESRSAQRQSQSIPGMVVERGVGEINVGTVGESSRLLKGFLTCPENALTYRSVAKDSEIAPEAATSPIVVLLNRGGPMCVSEA